MSLTLVTAPTASPLSVFEAKEHLRVDHADQDRIIQRHINAAVAYLDGYKGVLGRAIMEQTWSVSVAAAGTYVLPMPDVTSATIDYGSGAVALTLTATAAGPEFEATAKGTVQFAAAMPAEQLPTVKAVIELLVERDFDRPEGPALMALEAAVASRVEAIRWRSV